MKLRTKRWFFERINKIDNPLPRITKEKREKTHIMTIRNEKEVTTDIDMQRILLEYYENYMPTNLKN